MDVLDTLFRTPNWHCQLVPGRDCKRQVLVFSTRSVQNNSLARAVQKQQPGQGGQPWASYLPVDIAERPIALQRTGQQR